MKLQPQKKYFYLHTLLCNHFLIQILLLMFFYWLFNSFEHTVFCDAVTAHNPKISDSYQPVSREEIKEAFAYQQNLIKEINADMNLLWLGEAALFVSLFITVVYMFYKI